MPEKDPIQETIQTHSVRRWTQQGLSEGHSNAVAEAAETRRYNRMLKELEAEKASRRGLLAGVMGFFKSKR